MSTPPTGTVTFLFTDIEGSTRLWESHPEEMSATLARHDAILRQTIEASSGFIFLTAGDAFFAAFARASDALTAAVEAQKALQCERWPDATPIKVRMALNSGAVEFRDADYFGPPLNRAARLLAAAHGGQILVSGAAKDLGRNALLSGVRLLDLGMFALKDLPEPEPIWQVAHPDLSDNFPPLRVPPATVHNLPQTLSQFIGREREAVEAEGWFRQAATRLVTITGFGGMGKSRLAMEIARLCLPLFPEGVWWVELDTAPNGDALFTRLAENLRLPLGQSEGTRAQVCRALRERRLLLALDNLEQMPDAAEAVRDLLAAAPGVFCLVTTQRVLGLRGERILELATLPEADAVTLFVERARDVRAGFVLDENNRADVNLLCQRLEGVPLAIELAAARSTMMTPRQMVERLGERFRLLQSRSPDLPPRHRALLATIEWSHNLLPPDAQVTLAQLSVFAGGFTLDDAEAVCESFDVFEDIDKLRHHSLLRAETDADQQETRFLMLESVREFGEERLKAAFGGATPLEDRHAVYFLTRAEERLSSLRTVREGDALRRLDADASNLRIALRRSRGSLPLHSQLALAVGRWRYRRGFLRDAVEVVQEGIDALAPHATEQPALWTDLLRERSGLHLDFHEDVTAREMAQEALSLSEARGDAEGAARAENLLGQAAMNERDFPSARERFERALACFTQIGAAVEIAILRNNLGVVERRDASRCPPDERETPLQLAEFHLNEALRLRRASGDQRGIAETLTNLGVVAYERADWERSESFYREALSVEQSLRSMLGVAKLLYNLGEIALVRGEKAQESGEYTRAVRLFAVSERLFEEALSPYAADIAPFVGQAAAAARMSAATLDTLRSAIRALPVQDRIPFALGASPVPTDTE